MSLAARVCGFFLVTLAVVLAGVSVTFYMLWSAHLHRDLDERLGLALDAIATSVDVDPGRVEWIPGARPQIVVVRPDEDPVFWLVTDHAGVTVDRTWDVGSADSAALVKLAPARGHSHATHTDSRGRRWRATLRRIHAGPVAGALNEGALPEGVLSEPRSLVLSAVSSLEPVEAGLRNLALLLITLSIVFWLLAAVVGWRLCKRALLPVTRMANAAGSISMADGDHRLPIPGTGDELDLLAGAFNGLLDRLHQEFERQKRFAGDASHQLRTPLAALLGQLEVARRRERSVEEYRRVLDEAHGEALRLRQIVESLLFMARAESDAGTLDLEPVELSLWLRERLARRGGGGGERQADLRERLTTEAPAWVQAQPQLLGQMLDNLVDNACKYSPAGSPIEVEVGREGRYVTLAVKDQGPGIDALDLAHVFEPFYRSAKSRRRPGVGLGLAVVERIATVFGGTVRAESEPGHGSRFVIRLPDATPSIVSVEAPRAVKAVG